MTTYENNFGEFEEDDVLDLDLEDPCFCESGYKYKDCCWLQDVQDLPQHFWTVLQENAPEEYQTMKANMFKAALRRFDNYLADDNQDEYTILDRASDIYRYAQSYEQYEQFVSRMREFQNRAPEMYEQHAHFLNSYTLASTISMNRPDLTAEILNSVDPLRDIDLFCQDCEMIMYYGHPLALSALIALLKDHYDRVQEASGIIPAGIDNYNNYIIDLTIVHEFIQNPTRNANEIAELLDPYLHPDYDADWLENCCLRPLRNPLPVAREVLHNLKDYSPFISLTRIGWALTAFHKQQSGSPLSRSLLATKTLQGFVWWELRDQLTTTNLIPEYEAFDEYITSMCGMLLFQHWKMATVMELLPVYFDFLEQTTIIGPERAERLYTTFKPLAAEVYDVLDCNAEDLEKITNLPAANLAQTWDLKT